MKAVVFFTIVIFAFACDSYGQSESGTYRYPKVGDTILDHEFTDTENFPENKNEISDFRGKWLIVDFWSYYCSGCIASFPKMDRLQDKFEGQVQLLMIGVYSDRNEEKTRDIYKKTWDIYERMREIHGLDFAVAFDSLAKRKYDIGSFPTILLIDPEGIIRAKTTSIGETQLTKVINGVIPAFKRQYSAHEEIAYNKDLPLLTSGTMANGGVDTSFLYRSLLTFHKEELPTKFADLWRNAALQSGKLEVFGQSLKRLYLLAYFGSSSWSGRALAFRDFSQNLILETSDSTAFVDAKSGNPKLYDYSIIVPKIKASKAFFQQVMQNDLKRFFNYSVTVERREMPVYNMIVTDPSKTLKLKTRGGTPAISTKNKYLGYEFNNFPFDEFIGAFYSALPPGERYLPLINKTGLEFNVDATIEAYMMDMASVNKALETYGLQLKKGVQEMNTLVLK